MPEMLIRTEGAGGEFADVFRRHRRVEMPHNIPIRVETLDHGMKGGAPSCAFIIELPAERMVVLAQTSVKLFQMAAVATFAKYGDVTQGSFLGSLADGKFTMTMSKVADCPSCRRQIPGSCKYCMECGAKL
jgi:hypothetical protein